MESYATEEQQVEAIKSWWKSNGNAVIFGTVLGLAGLVGFRYYNDSNAEAQEAVSAGYDDIAAQLAEQGLGAKEATQAFIDSNAGNAYASLTALQFAAEAVKDADYVEAEKQLSWVVKNSNEATIIPIAGLRLARVQAEQGNFDAALATLETITLESFSGKVAEVKGDIFVQQNKPVEARVAYQAALGSTDANVQLLQLKLDDLAVAPVADDLEAEIAGEINE